MEAFWFQFRPVDRLDRLSIESYLNHGYSFTLYTYGSLHRAPAIPVPARYADARKILPEPVIPTGPTAAVQMAAFETRFRLAALWAHGGLLARTDYVVLDDLPQDPFVIWHNGKPFKDLIHATPRSPVVQNMLESADPYRDLQFCWPEKRRLDSEGRIQTDPNDIEEILVQPVYSIGGAGYCLWRDSWVRGGFKPGSQHPDDCLYEQLWRMHFGPSAVYKPGLLELLQDSQAFGDTALLCR
jgi:hypothetical protein